MARAIGTATPDSSRRRLLGLSAAALPLLLARPGSALAALPARGQRVLALRNLHTEERLETVYWENGYYDVDALADINHILRDFRTGDVKAIDPRLLDLLNAIQRETRQERPFHVISGYRSPQTNAMLAARSNRVAKNSYHMRGMAIDIRLPGYELKRLHSATKALRGGGLGYYPNSSFIHVDVGPVRYW